MLRSIVVVVEAAPFTEVSAVHVAPPSIEESTL